MNRAIIGLPVDEDAPGGLLETVGFENRALHVLATQAYLDGGQIQHGYAADTIEEQVEVPVMRDSGRIDFSEQYETSKIATEWIADLEGEGFMAVDTSDGTFAFDIAWHQTHQNVKRASIDIEALFDTLDDHTGPGDYWMATGEDVLGTSIRYNDSVTRDAAEAANRGVGFEYAFEGTRVKGVCYDSGYCAAWPDADWEWKQFSGWLVAEILPHASFERDDEDETEDQQEWSDYDGGSP